MPFLHHALLVLDLGLLGAAGLRLASLAAPRGLERAVATIVLAAAGAVLLALALGLVGLGTSAAALTLAAGAVWLASRALLPAPELRAGRELAAWPASLDGGARVALGALAGAWLAWAAWLLKYPALGIDSLSYHLPQIVAWVHGGRPGAVVDVLPELPVGNYPLTNEVLLSWATGISRGFSFVTVFAPLMLLILTAAGWVGLRALRVSEPLAALAIAAVVATPVLTSQQMNGASTDLPALTWLVCCAALAAASARYPRLLAIAVVAAGLAVGTKTTGAPLAAVVLGLGVVANRARLRELRWWLTFGGAAALAVGGYWYARNLVDHGNPLWPFLRPGFGDPLPPHFRDAYSFWERPGVTIDRIGSDYLDLFAGGLVMLGGAFLAPLVSRKRGVVAGAALTALMVILWGRAPVTGVSDFPLFDEGTLSTVRYLTPALAAAAVTLCLAAREGGAARALAIAVLAAAVVLGAVQTADLGPPSVPSIWTVLAGAALGSVAAAVAGLLSLTERGGRVAIPVVAAGLAIVLGATANGFTERHADTGMFDREMATWAAGQPAFDDGDVHIAMSPLLSGAMAGDRIQNSLELLPPRADCARVRARLRTSWVIVHRLSFEGTAQSSVQRCLVGTPASHEGLSFLAYGRAPR